MPEYPRKAEVPLEYYPTPFPSPYVAPSPPAYAPVTYTEQHLTEAPKPKPAPTPTPTPLEYYPSPITALAPTPTPITPTSVTPTFPLVSPPAYTRQPAYAPYRPQPAISPPQEAYQKWRPQREFYIEKYEEMRKKRLGLAKTEEAKPVSAIPPTIKFGAYEVKTEYVAIGASLALIIIAVVLLT